MRPNQTTNKKIDLNFSNSKTISHPYFVRIDLTLDAIDLTLDAIDLTSDGIYLTSDGIYLTSDGIYPVAKTTPNDPTRRPDFSKIPNRIKKHRYRFAQIP